MKLTKKFLFLNLFVLSAAATTVYAFNFSDQATIQEKYGERCEIDEECGGMYYVDCGAATDGPAYFLDKSYEVIGTSGGLCMGGHCSGAPDSWVKCKSEQDKQKGDLE